MKKYIQSFKLFFGSCPMKNMLIYDACILAVVVLITLLGMLFGGGDDFLSGMLEGMSLTVGIMAAFSGVIMVSALYMNLSPETAGYKYFRSVPGGEAHFRRCIISANIFSLIEGGVMIGLAAAVFAAVGADMSGIIAVAFILPLITGICDFTGFIGRNTAKVVMMVAALSLGGFIAGFSSGMLDDEGATMLEALGENPLPLFIAFGAAILVYAGGIIYALTQCRRKWGGSACAD